VRAALQVHGPLSRGAFAVAVLAGALVLSAVASELVQGLIGRDAAWGDVVADVVGALLGLLVWRLLVRRAAHQRDGLA
jgi:VanZ family protein